jgi:hypothetical protein
MRNQGTCWTAAADGPLELVAWRIKKIFETSTGGESVWNEECAECLFDFQMVASELRPEDHNWQRHEAWVGGMKLIPMCPCPTHLSKRFISGDALRSSKSRNSSELTDSHPEVD